MHSPELYPVLRPSSPPTEPTSIPIGFGILISGRHQREGLSPWVAHGWKCEEATYVFIFTTFAWPWCTSAPDGCSQAIILDVLSVGFFCGSNMTFKYLGGPFCSFVTGWFCGSTTPSSRTLVPGAPYSFEVTAPAAWAECRFQISANPTRSQHQSSPIFQVPQVKTHIMIWAQVTY